MIISDLGGCVMIHLFFIISFFGRDNEPWEKYCAGGKMVVSLHRDSVADEASMLARKLQ